MKRFELWLTMVTMFSMPALVFAQATGGSTDKKVIKNGTVTANGHRKGSVRPDLARKGSANAPKTNGTGNAPKVDTTITSATGGAGSGRVTQTCTGRKGNVQPTMSARKRPPRPRPAKLEDKKLEDKK